MNILGWILFILSCISVIDRSIQLLTKESFKERVMEFSSLIISILFVFYLLKTLVYI